MGNALCPAIISHQLQTQLLEPQFQIYKQKPYTYVTNIMKQNNFWIGSTQSQIDSFFQQLSKKYNPIPYHNITHGFDVMTALDTYLTKFKMLQSLGLNQEQRIHMLIAAYAHDNGHRGLNTSFYINSNDQLAITYSDQSPLQNMHSSNLLQCFRNHNITPSKQNRNLMIKMILATDNAHHKQLLEKLQLVIRTGWNRKQNNSAMIQILIHTADLSICGKDLDMYIKWNKRLYQQFEDQAAIQKQRGLPISFQFDEKDTNKSKAASNISFLSGMIMPLFKSLCKIQTKFQIMVQNAENNKKYFQKMQIQKIK